MRLTLCLQPFTSYFPRANIHQMICQDLLHQVIKGMFKDHLITWVVDYIQCSNSDGDTSRLLNELDHQWVVFHNVVCCINSLTVLNIASPSWLPFHAYTASLKGKASSNGQVMIQRPSWRYFYPPLRASYQLIWLDAWPLSLTSVISCAKTSMIPLLSLLLKKHLTSFTSTVTSSRM